MDKLNLQENKKRVLNQVILYALRGVRLETLDTEIKQFKDKINHLRAKTFGPFVTYHRGTTMSENGYPKIDYDVMVQAENYLDFKGVFQTVDYLECSDCVYVRFDDHPSYLNFAYAKLDIHFYENNYQSDGTFYSVVISDSPYRLVMDIFKPKVML